MKFIDIKKKVISHDITDMTNDFKEIQLSVIICCFNNEFYLFDS